MGLVVLPICIFSHTIVFPVFVAILSCIGAYEMLRCVGAVRKWAVSLPLVLGALAFPMIAYFVGGTEKFCMALCAYLAFIMVWLFAIPVFTAGETDVTEVSISFMGVTYITVSLSALILLRYGENGAYFYLVPVIAPMICDIFAYFTGKFFGKHKLIPKVSPKKTVEGSVGGTLFCIAACCVYGAIINGTVTVMPVWAFAVGGAVISVVSQVGDLIASAIKRHYGVKDYGKIFPGHGGVMDRLDSVIATIPLFLIFTYLI